MMGLGVLIGLLVGAASCGLYFGVRLKQARRDAAAVRALCDTERLERARCEIQLSQLVPLERQSQALRDQVAALTSERARLEAIAERVPALEEALSAAHDELV